MDTTLTECKKCGFERDCIDGMCESCTNGVYYCACGEEISEEALEVMGVCSECK